jgi:hypothetical protein
MSLSKPALACALAAAVLAATAVAEQRVGLALTLVLLLVIAAGVLGAEQRPSPLLVVLAGALALQPLLRDARWVVALDLFAALVAGAAAVSHAGRWARLAWTVLAPFRLVAGSAVVVRTLEALRPKLAEGRVRPLARGLVLAAALTALFGSLFASADSAFADVVGTTVDLHLDGGPLLWRGVLALLFLACAGALCRAGVAPEVGPAGPPRRLIGRTELLFALGAVVALFAAFVAVQLRVLFGGADYVQETTGLGYGEYARHGFSQLLLVATLTLGVIAVAARTPDRAVRALLGALCVLTLVVLLSAHHRLDLVEDAYGATRVRLAGEALVLWISAVFGLVLLAGLRPALARHLPAVVTTLTLGGVLAFSLSNPDGRIARSAVERAAAGQRVDTWYLAHLSADALPTLRELPAREGDSVVADVRARLARPDGLAGLNVSRARARGQ